MKKFLLYIILLLPALFIQHADGQTSGSTTILFYDNNGVPYFPQPTIVIRNTDSTNHQNPFSYVSRSYTYEYTDSFAWDTANQDSAVSIHYYSCGQWNTLDTFYTVYHPNWSPNTFYRLSIDIQLPCARPCTAAFTKSNSSGSNSFYFYSATLGSGGTHFWDFGDGQISNYQSPYHYFDSVGTLGIKHVIHDPSRNCSDSIMDSISISPHCFAGFNYSYTSNANQIALYATNGNSYTHLWVCDGDSVYGQRALTYTFSTSGIHTVTHTSSYQNQCTDTYTRSIQTQGCQIGMTTMQSSGVITFIPSDTTKVYFYVFGDGDSSYHSGTFNHIYTQSGNYTAVVKDSSNACVPKIINLSIQSTCNSTFALSNPSSHVLRAVGIHNANLNSRYIINSSDTLTGDSVDYTAANKGNYSVRREIYDQSGAIHCSGTNYLYFTTCGTGTNYYQPEEINGRVVFNNQYSTNYGALRIYLIDYDSVNGTLTGIDSVDLSSSSPDSAYFSFSPVCDMSKTYLVKAALLSSSSIYSSYIPTYYPNSTSWSGASALYPGSYINIIHMTAGSNPGGSGFIGGQISQGANKNFHPLEGIQVNLFNDQDEPVAYTFSDQDGKYQFSNLAFGKYKVIVELGGKTSSFYWVDLSQANPESKGKDFEVNSTYVSLLNSVQPAIKVVSGLYPNPAENALFIQWAEEIDGPVEIQVMSIDGKIMKSERHIVEQGETSTINVSILPQGIYLIRMSGNFGSATYQIQKN
ncbi:MAG: T9SS type A sorting domain-containing protein [Bacteroidetes bacterium]|nr:T9SS type A sorting domain-containing protein [Bacteroidota bacterium]